jgi:hypothetical protein
MIHYQTWQPQAILVSDWPIFFNLLQTTDTKRWQKLILPLARIAKKNIKM